LKRWPSLARPLAGDGLAPSVIRGAFAAILVFFSIFFFFFFIFFFFFLFTLRCVGEAVVDDRRWQERVRRWVARRGQWLQASSLA